MGNAEILKQSLVAETVAMLNYREFSQRAKEPMLKRLFELFASNEEWHVNVLRRLMQNYAPKEELGKLEDVEIMCKQLNIGPVQIEGDKNMLKKALELEEKQAEEFEKFAGGVEKFPLSELQETFLLFAENEKLHANMIRESLENI